MKPEAPVRRIRIFETVRADDADSTVSAKVLTPRAPRMSSVSVRSF